MVVERNSFNRVTPPASILLRRAGVILKVVAANILSEVFMGISILQSLSKRRRMNIW